MRCKKVCPEPTHPHMYNTQCLRFDSDKEQCINIRKAEDQYLMATHRGIWRPIRAIQQLCHLISAIHTCWAPRITKLLHLVMLLFRLRWPIIIMVSSLVMWSGYNYYGVSLSWTSLSSSSCIIIHVIVRACIRMSIHLSHFNCSIMTTSTCKNHQIQWSRGN